MVILVEHPGSVVHVAVVLNGLTKDGPVCAVGTSQVIAGKPDRIRVDWSANPARTWIDGWPKDCGVGYFYAHYVQKVPSGKIRDEIGIVPDSFVDELLVMWSNWRRKG